MTAAPLRRFVKRYFVPGFALRYLYPGESGIEQLEQAMWGGFAKPARDALEAVKVDPGRSTGAIAQAAWVLARHYATEGDPERALQNLTLRRRIWPDAEYDIGHAVLEIDANLRLGRVDEAEAIVTRGIGRFGPASGLCLSAANAVAADGSLKQSQKDARSLAWLNRPFLEAGLAPLELKDRARGLSLDNIAAPAAVADPGSDRAKISVLMAAYNAESSIATAMASVLAQTWTNLELVVVDDGSTDSTWSIVQSAAARDGRVVLLRHEENLGAYAARNTALEVSSGDVVTVHDADGWSHPQKLALQVSDLLGSGAPVNTTMRARVHPDMRVEINPTDGTVLTESIASVLVRRTRVLELGGWDKVRLGADDEFYQRLLLLERRPSSIVGPEVPLAFDLARDDIGLPALLFGARREYQDSYRHWHLTEAKMSQPRLSLPKDGRAFPVPNICKHGRPAKLVYDILFVSDYTFPGGTTSSNANMLIAASRLGLRCGCFHWPRMLSAGKAMNPKIRHLLHEGIAEAVVAPEAVTSKLVIVYQPMLLNDLPDRLPAVRAEHCVLGVNQTPLSRTSGGVSLYRLDDAIENLHRAFGLEPSLAPISPVIRRMLQADSDYRDYTELDWLPLIDAAMEPRRASAWDSSRAPVIGRHSRDASDKWLSDPAALRQAYCADTGLEVRILGGAEMAKAVLGHIPSNWTVQPFDSISVQTFLSGLDFFVHYPHQNWVEAFGRAPMEAMNAGVPAILPPVFQETFGAAALYVEPAGVQALIQSLWQDRAAYDAQVERGFDFVDKNCALERFADRVAPYLGRTASRRSAARTGAAQARA